MKELIEFLNHEISEIENDSRFKAKSATVFSNAPLALIQCSMTAQSLTLRKVLRFIEEQQKTQQPET